MGLQFTSSVGFIFDVKVQYLSTFLMLDAEKFSEIVPSFDIWQLYVWRQMRVKAEDTVRRLTAWLWCGISATLLCTF